MRSAARERAATATCRATPRLWDDHCFASIPPQAGRSGVGVMAEIPLLTISSRYWFLPRYWATYLLDSFYSVCLPVRWKLAREKDLALERKQVGEQTGGCPRARARQWASGRAFLPQGTFRSEIALLLFLFVITRLCHIVLDHLSKLVFSCPGSSPIGA